jgi:hypothetical protein
MLEMDSIMQLVKMLKLLLSKWFSHLLTFFYFSMVYGGKLYC